MGLKIFVHNLNPQGGPANVQPHPNRISIASLLSGDLATTRTPTGAASSFKKPITILEGLFVFDTIKAKGLA